MKNKCFILSLFLFLTLSSFSFTVYKNYSKDKLIGKWILQDSYSPDFSKKIDSLKIYQKVDDFTKKLIKESDPTYDLSKLSDSATAYMNDFEKKQIKEFMEDGTFIFTNLSDGSKSKGKWKIQIDKVPNRNFNSIILDYDANDYLKCCIPIDQAEQLRVNNKELQRVKKIHFNFVKITNDSIICKRYIDEPNKNGYTYLNDVYIKQK